MPGFADEGSVHHTNVVSPSNPEERRTWISAKLSREPIVCVSAEMLIFSSFSLCNAVRAASLLVVAANVTFCKDGLSLDKISGRGGSIDADPAKSFPYNSKF